jgi:hypothetical protein
MQTNTTTSLEFIEIGFAADETGVFLPDVAGDFERAARYCSSAKELALESLKATEQLRDLAIIHLLTTGSWPIFQQELQQSGDAWIMYLTRCQEEGALDDFHRASGVYEPLLSVVAAGDLDRARRIAELSPAKWRKQREHEEDYLYAQLLYRLLDSAVSENEVAELLQRYQTSLEGRPATRLEVLRALAQRHQAGFDAAFAALLQEERARLGPDVPWDHAEFEAEIERTAAAIAADGEDAHSNAEVDLVEKLEDAHARVFVEGLALLHLAQARGLVTQPEYPFCPAAARPPR